MSRLKMSGSHTYTLDGHKVPGVTTAIGVLDKPALVNWAADQAATAAINGLYARIVKAAVDRDLASIEHLDLVGEYNAIKAAHRNRTRKAAVRGTRIHALAERLSHGEEVEVPDELAGPVEAVARFLDTWELSTVATEVSVAHTAHLYAGTFDVVATSPRIMGGAPVLMDYKTGKGVYREVALQLAAYRYADYAARKTETTGPRGGKRVEWVEQDMPAVEGTFVIKVEDDTAVLVPVAADEDAFRQFLYALQLFRWVQAEKENPVIGDVVFPEQGAIAS